MLTALDQVHVDTPQQRIMVAFLKAVMPSYIRALDAEIRRNSKLVDVLGALQALCLNQIQYLFQMANPTNQHQLAEEICDQLKNNLHLAIDNQLDVHEFESAKPQ